ncbi:YdiU family protein [Hyphomonas sp.]|uniref:protein adenylyltransferase SelO family protein n=1 Tax=Hyphomonas sp. TaxID=87 RepID=UPI0030F5F976
MLREFPSPAPFLALADHFADAVEPAHFPSEVLRFRNRRWANAVGLGDLDDAQWLSHFSRFESLPGNLPQPLAMRYHGHQFGTYNPQLGDGRGFLSAQVRDRTGRLLDLGTKGSGQTPWSRQGDGRLTLKGGVREILAATYLETLGVHTSKAFSLVETGEQLHRNDEPSPTRGAVLVRLSESHIRFGTFQRAAYLNDREGLVSLVDYCVAQFHPGADAPDMATKAVNLLGHITRATASMIGQWMAAGFVHGVMNTDNFNVTGETFDFGPWRFLPVSDPNFTAAYFDQNGLYRFGRQPTQGAWALQQLASALLPLAEADDLARGLAPYEAAYQQAFAAHTHLLLGLAGSGDLRNDLTFLQGLYGWMTTSGASWPQTFFDLYGGAASEARMKASPQAALYETSDFAPVRDTLAARTPTHADRLSHPYFQAAAPVVLLIEDVESLWAPIAERDDWSAFDTKMAHLEAARTALAP